MMRLLLIICIFVMCGCEEVILHDLTEPQINHALIVLSKVGISANKELSGVGWSLKVNKDKANQALAVLEATRLFSVEVAQSSSSFGLIQSSEERAYSIQERLSKRIEDTLKRFPGVLDARVHLFRAKRDLLDPPTEEENGSASVLLIVEQGQQIDPGAVKDLVSGAVGISIAGVSVVVSETETQLEVVKLSEEEILENSLPKKDSGNIGSPLKFYLAVIIFSATLISLLIFYLRRRSEARNATQSLQPLSKLEVEEAF